MTISSTTAATRTNTNGVAHTFNYGHPFQDPDDLLVYLVTIADWSIALQTRDTHYTVSDNGNEDEVGGTITFINELQVATAPANGKICVILRKPELIQDYNPSTVYQAAEGEAALDRVYQALQYLQLRADRSIHLPDALPDATVELPNADERAGKALVFDSSGNLTVGVTGDSVLTGSEAARDAAIAAAAVAAGHASTATGAASSVATNVQLAEDWAVKVNGIVNGEDYSSKAYAIGGSGVTGGAGAAKEWANRIDANVDGTDPSAKSWALGGTPVTGIANRGSAKDWATKTDGSPATAEYSAKAYAVGGTGVDGADGSAKAWADKTNGAVDGAGTGFSAKAWANGGTSVSGTAARGAAKEWAIKTDGNVDTSDASAKAWSVGGTDVTNVAGRGAAKEWATKAEDATVDGTEFSAKHYAAKAAQEAANAAAVSENPALTFNFDSATGDADPGDGEFRINNATYASATFVYIDNVDFFGNDVTGWLDYMDDANTMSKGILMFRDTTDPLAYAMYRVNGSVQTASTYRKVPVTVIASGTNAFSGLISVMFVPGTEFPSSIDFNFEVDADLDVTGALAVGGGAHFTGGALPTQFGAKGVYLGTETNGNEQFNIISTGTYGYFDIGGINEDYKFRFLTEIATGNTTLTALGSLLLNGVSNGSATDFTVPDEAYNATNWNGSLEVPTKNAVRDQFVVVSQDLTDHLNDTTDAHDASAISIVDSGGYFTGTQVEAALQEIGLALAAVEQAVVLKGTWAANAGTFPGSGAAQAGWSYIVSTAGTVGGVDFALNDRIVAITDNASTSTYAANWHKLDYTDQVLSVAGKTGAVTLALADITDMSANGRSLVALTYANMRAALDLEAGTDFYSISAANAAFQPLDADLTSIAALTTTSYGRGLLESVDAATLFGTLKQAATNSATGVVEHATDAEVQAATTGNIVLLASHIESAAAPETLTYASPTTSVDWDAAINWTLTMTGNVALGNPTNGQPGTYRTVLVQGNDGTSRTLSFGNQYGGEVPGLTDITSTQKYLVTIYCKSSTQFLVTAIDGSDA